MLHTHRDTTGPARLDTSEGAEFATVLAVAIALEAPGGVVLRGARGRGNFSPSVLRGARGRGNFSPSV
ncbi:hypothetical protein ABZ086_36635, partial [Streptomyces halstedii]